MRRIRYHEEARLELLHEVGYYSAISRRLGERFDLAVQAAVQRASGDDLFVLAIAPFARKPGYWRKRRYAG